MDTLTLVTPDDWHLHLRDGWALRSVLPYTARVFGRAVIMPNLKPPVFTTDDAMAYRARILSALPNGSAFQPLMTLYLTDRTTPEELARAKAAGVVGVKLYPAGATTNSDAGVADIAALDPVLDALSELGMPLLVHGEVTDPAVDVFDREARFIEQWLAPIIDRHPELRVVFEHITTREAVQFVLSTGPQVAATVTAHHLLMNRNALFEGGVRPHRYCLPVLKREAHRHALVRAVVCGSRKFFLGTDSAPHARHTKEAPCGCAGMFTAAHALELYAEVFDAADALDQLESFASLNGPRFYGLPINEGTVTLQRVQTPVPPKVAFGRHTLVPFRAGGEVAWQVEVEHHPDA